MKHNTYIDTTIISAKLFNINSFIGYYLVVNLFTLLLSKCSCIRFVYVMQCSVQVKHEWIWIINVDSETNERGGNDEGGGAVNICVFPGGGEGRGEGATRYPKICNVFFMTLAY